MFRVSASELRKQLRRLGLKVDVVEVDASEVLVRTKDGRELVIEEPDAVVLVKLPNNTAMIQAVGSLVEREAATPLKYTEEDVKFVAEQAGVSLDEARQALEEAEGDIAAAILLLQERKMAS